MQDESLSPFPFSLYENFEIELIKKMCLPIDTRRYCIIFIRRPLTPFRDRARFARYAHCLQQYTSKQKLKLNEDKTKSVVFRKDGKLNNNH